MAEMTSEDPDKNFFDWSLIILSTVSFSLNFLVFILFIRFRHRLLVSGFRRKVLMANHNKMLFSLVLGDLFVGLTGLTTGILLLTKQNIIIYKLCGTIPMFGGMFVSIFSLGLMTFDRLIAVKRPIRYISLMPRKRAISLICFTWMLPIAITITESVVLVAKGADVELKVRAVMLTLVFLSGLIVLSVTNWVLFVTVKKRWKRLPSAEKHQTLDQNLSNGSVFTGTSVFCLTPMHGSTPMGCTTPDILENTPVGGSPMSTPLGSTDNLRSMDPESRSYIRNVFSVPALTVTPDASDNENSTPGLKTRPARTSGTLQVPDSNGSLSSLSSIGSCTSIESSASPPKEFVNNIFNSEIPAGRGGSCRDSTSVPSERPRSLRRACSFSNIVESKPKLAACRGISIDLPIPGTNHTFANNNISLTMQGNQTLPYSGLHKKNNHVTPRYNDTLSKKRTKRRFTLPKALTARDLRICIMCVWIVSVFLVCFTPLIGYRFSYVIGRTVTIPWLRRLSLCLALSNSLLNPLIYFLERRDFRQLLLRLIKFKVIKRAEKPKQEEKCKNGKQ